MSTAISHSRVESYLSCRRKDWYGYQYPTEEGRGIRRQETSDSLALGTAFHRIAAVYYQAIMDGAERNVAVFKAQGEHEKIIEEGFEDRGGNYATLDEVMQRWIENERFSEDYEILGVEMEFNLGLEEGEFPFVVDLLIRDRRGLIYAVDHKTGYYLYTPEQVELMPQLPKYVGALRALGYNVAGGIYQVVRTQKISGEKMLKAELVETLAKHFTEELTSGADDAPQQVPTEDELKKMKVEALQYLCDQEGIEHTKPVPAEKVYQVLDVPMSATRVNETLREQFEVSAELRARDLLDPEVANRTAYRTANQTVCKSCSFRLLCSVELAGGNARLTYEHEYEPKPKRDAIELSLDYDEAT